MNKVIKAIHSLQWRLRYTIAGQRRLPWLGWAEWWDWSATDYAEVAEYSTPAEAVQEELYAMAAEQ